MHIYIPRFCYVNHKKLPNIRCFTYKFPCDFARFTMAIFTTVMVTIMTIITYDLPSNNNSVITTTLYTNFGSSTQYDT